MIMHGITNEIETLFRRQYIIKIVERMISGKVLVPDDNSIKAIIDNMLYV